MPLSQKIPGWYRRWVQLYPNPFRTEYGEELVLLFEETWRDSQAAPTSQRLKLLAFVAWDGFRSLVKEWSSALRWTTKALLAGGVLMVLTDVASGIYSGPANAVYFWGSMAVTAAIARPIRRRHWAAALLVMGATAAALYFGCSALQIFVPARDVHARFGEITDVIGLGIVILALLAMRNAPRRNQGSQNRFRDLFGDRPLIGYLQFASIAAVVAGMIRQGVFHHSDDTGFLLIVGNMLLDVFRSTWSREVNAPRNSIA